MDSGYPLYCNGSNTEEIEKYKKITPRNVKMTPAALRQVHILRIWLDFYEDDMSPWVLSCIHIQRSYTKIKICIFIKWQNQIRPRFFLLEESEAVYIWTIGTVIYQEKHSCNKNN